MKTAKDDRPEDHPHSPDVAERETADGGFSRGWGLHFQPNEAYWLDCHNHLRESLADHAELYRLLDEWFAALDAYRLGRVIAIAKDPQAFPVCRDVAAHERRFGWLFWMPHDCPDPDALRRALDHGALGLKLHNAPLMRGEADPEVWLQKAWAQVFEVLDHARGAVLWHVTQRTGVSPYHGGGANSYWGEAQTGARTSNEQLLRMTLQIASRYPGMSVVGAHQLHLGPDRLAALFDEHENLSIDTSCGFFTRWADELYEDDWSRLRRFVLRYSTRILFGTDSTLATGARDAYAVEAFLCHARFIKQLRLPDTELQQVAHGNAERVFQLDALAPERRGNARP